MHIDDINKLAGLGIHFHEAHKLRLLDDNAKEKLRAGDSEFTGEIERANDIAPGLLGTASNAGILGFLQSFIDPTAIEYVFAPLRSEEAFGSQQQGNWLTTNVFYKVIEPTADVSIYSDTNNNGRSGHNINTPSRNTQHFQTFVSYFERDAATEGLLGVDYIRQQNNAADQGLMRRLNNLNIYGMDSQGVGDFKLYGSLNDPNLLAPILPSVKEAGPPISYSWTTDTKAEKIYADFNLLYGKLVSQLGGNIQRDDKMTLVLSNAKEPYLSNMNTLGTTTARELIQNNYPNLRIIQIPEYETQGGSVMQLFKDEINGVRTTTTIYTERMRSHAIIPRHGGWDQKKTNGGGGFVMRYPIALAQMTGI